MAITVHFAHKTIRRIVIAFGTLFNNYKIEKPDGTIITVPCTWASKSKWYTMLEQDPTKSNVESLMLPRLGFTIAGMSYDFARKVSSINKLVRKNDADGNNPFRTYTPVPYNIDFELFLVSKSADEGLQLIEQIMPYFTPSFNITINELDTMNVMRDIPIILNSVNTDFVREGSFDGSDLYEWSLNFTVEANIYKNIETYPIIKKVVVDTYTLNDSEEEVVKERYTATVDPFTAYIDDEYQVLETLGLISADEPKLPEDPV
jgi:hypothetical protein